MRVIHWVRGIQRKIIYLNRIHLKFQFAKAARRDQYRLHLRNLFAVQKQAMHVVLESMLSPEAIADRVPGGEVQLDAVDAFGPEPRHDFTEHLLTNASAPVAFGDCHLVYISPFLLFQTNRNWSLDLR